MPLESNISCEELELNKDAPEPLHLQLQQTLLRQLRLSGHAQEKCLPSERKLAEFFNVNRATVHRAYAELIRLELVERLPNKGLLIASGASQKLRSVFPTIGLVLPMRFSDFIERNNQGALQYLKGIIDRATELNCSTTMLQLPAPETNAEILRCYVREKCEPMTGLIHFGSRGIPEDAPLTHVFKETKIPQVCISGIAPFAQIGRVGTDVKPGVEELCSALQTLGHSRIGIISYFAAAADPGDEKALFVYDARMQEQKVLKIFERHQLACRDEWQLYSCRDVAGLAARLKTVLADADTPKVFWCNNCSTARIAYEAFQLLGVRVPHDISLAGYNAPHAIPEMSGLLHPFREIGAAAVDWIFEHGQKNNSRNAVFIPAKFQPGNTLAKITEPSTIKNRHSKRSVVCKKSH